MLIPGTLTWVGKEANSWRLWCVLPFGRALWKTSIGPQTPPRLKEEKPARPRLFLYWLQGLRGLLLFASLVWTQSWVSVPSTAAWQSSCIHFFVFTHPSSVPDFFVLFFIFIWRFLSVCTFTSDTFAFYSHFGSWQKAQGCVLCHCS